MLGIMSIIIHEIGHAIVAKLCGWKCVYLFVCGFIITFHKGIRINLLSKSDFSLMGGAIAILPPQNNIVRSSHYAFILLGGALLNLVVFAMLFAIGVVFQNIYLLALSAMPIANTVSCMLPIKFKFSTTDGRKIINILKGGNTALEEILRLRICIALIEKTIPDLSDSELTLLISSEDKLSQYFGYAYKMLCAREKGMIEVCLQAENDLKILINSDKDLQLLDRNQFRIGEKNIL